MDYVRIKTTRQRDNETTSRDVKSASESVLTVTDVKELLKDWIKLYPNSFASDVEFKIYQLTDGDIIIQLHEDMSSLAVALLVLYLESYRHMVAKTPSRDVTYYTDENKHYVIGASEQVTESVSTAFITIDDTEVLLKQNLGKRAMIYCESSSHQVTKSPSRDVTYYTDENKHDVIGASTQYPTAVRFLLEDNYVLDYDFERKPQPVKDSGLKFEEPEFILPENYEIVRVGEVVKKKIDEVLEPDVLTPQKMMWYLICGAVGLAIGFLVVYFTIGF